MRNWNHTESLCKRLNPRVRAFSVSELVLRRWASASNVPALGQARRAKPLQRRSPWRRKRTGGSPPVQLAKIFPWEKTLEASKKISFTKRFAIRPGRSFRWPTCSFSGAVQPNRKSREGARAQPKSPFPPGTHVAPHKAERIVESFEPLDEPRRDVFPSATLISGATAPSVRKKLLVEPRTLLKLRHRKMTFPRRRLCSYYTSAG